MNHRPLIAALLGLIGMGLLGCSTIGFPSKVRARYQLQHPDLEPRIASAIRSETIVPGMSVEQAAVALGICHDCPTDLQTMLSLRLPRGSRIVSVDALGNRSELWCNPYILGDASQTPSGLYIYFTNGVVTRVSAHR